MRNEGRERERSKKKEAIGSCPRRRRREENKRASRRSRGRWKKE